MRWKAEKVGVRQVSKNLECQAQEIQFGSVSRRVEAAEIFMKGRKYGTRIFRKNNVGGIRDRYPFRV